MKVEAWNIFGGFLAGIGWLLAGIFWCITIIGIPIGLQCFKIAGLSFCSFGKRVIHSDSTGCFLINMVLLIINGLPLAVVHCMSGAILCIKIIGIPFGLQSFKLARLALMPFGARIVLSDSFYME